MTQPYDRRLEIAVTIITHGPGMPLRIGRCFKP
jgi:hypothetical protein